MDKINQKGSSASSEDIKLLACPFCGGKAEFEKGGFYFELFCTGCLARSEASTDKNEVVKFWNNRI